MCGSFLVSGANFLSTLVAIPLIKQFNRQTMWYGGFALCAVGLALFVVCYALSNEQPSQALVIAASVVFIVGFEVGPGPVFILMACELFPRRFRGSCMSVCLAVNWVTNIVVVLVFPFFQQIWEAFGLYLALLGVAVAVMWFNTVETKGKNAEEIERLMGVEDPE